MMHSVIQLLQNSAKKHPDKNAIKSTSGAITFLQLETKAKSIGTALCNFGVFRKSVAVLMPKSEDCFAAFMGVTWAGGFYTPLCPTMPKARVAKILNTLKCENIVVKKQDENYISDIIKNENLNLNVLFYEDLCENNINEKQLDNVQNKLISTDLLYVIFTSGSTGTPKGVCISHGALINFASSITEVFNITHEDTFGNQAAFYFDLSVMDIACMLFAQSTIYLIDAQLFSQPVALLQCIKDEKINTIAWVPSAMVMVSKLRAFKNVDVKDVLKKVLFIGEVMPAKQFTLWRKALPDAFFSNFYGPTEATVACTASILTRDYEPNESVPIGKPLKNYDVFLLNAQNELIQPSNTSEQGEICIRGASVARGYYANEEMTKAAFVQNPLNSHSPEIIYRTGDSASYDENGELLYIGRIDFQIKHMGNRIEPGEIEASAMKMKGIENTCVVYDERRKKLVMFYEGVQKDDDIKTYLQEVLPPYMQPSRLIHTDKMPLNANGKINRSELLTML